MCSLTAISKKAEVSVVVIVSGTKIEIGGGVPVTATVAKAVAPGNATLVAMTLSVPALEGAVYKPELEIVPPAPPGRTLQVTAVLVVPATLAVNCCVEPVRIVGLAGVTLIAGSIVTEYAWLALSPLVSLAVIVNENTPV